MLLGTVPWSLLLLALSPAYADEAACHQCCRASGLSECATELRLYGQESRVSRDSGGWLLRGVWDVSCNGRARFDGSAEVYLDHQPTFGELAMPEVDPREVDCFLRSCSMPSGLCLAPPDASGVRVLRDCASAIPADAVLLARPASPALASNPSHVVIGGRAIAVASAQAAPGAEVTPAMAVTLPGRGAPSTAPAAPAAPVVTTSPTVAQPAADPWGSGAAVESPAPPNVAPAATSTPAPASTGYGSVSTPRVAPSMAATPAAASAPAASPAPATTTPATTTPATAAPASSAGSAAGRTWIDSYSPSTPAAAPAASAPASTTPPPVRVAPPATTYTPPASAATTYTPPASAAVATPPAAVVTPPTVVTTPPAAVTNPAAVVTPPPASTPAAPKGPPVKPYGQTGVPVSAYGSTAPDPTGPTGDWATSSATNDPINQLVAGLPTDPAAGCKPTSEAGATEARNLANTAEDLRIAGKYNDALSRFRAVVQLDRCNAWGWLGLGQTATALKRPDVAVRSLRNTVTLIPAHYGAWTELGKAYEAIGDKARALDAYSRALSLREDYPEALSGAKRLKGM